MTEEKVLSEPNQVEEKALPEFKHFEGVGELTVGGVVAGGDVTRILFTAFALQNNPVVNDYLLANKVKLEDRLTKTRIFPRDGMALPNGEYYSGPKETTVNNEENKDGVTDPSN